jgi:hypothetical protein
MTTSPSLFKLEQEIAYLLIDKLRSIAITPERAAQIARFVLSALPESLTDTEVENVIPKLDDQFYELSEIVFKHMQEYEEKNKPIVLAEVDKLIREGNFDEAMKLMREYLAKTKDEIVAPKP